MENYIVTFKYKGRIHFPEDPEQASKEGPIILLPLLEENKLEFYTVNYLFPSERFDSEDYDASKSNTWTILEFKLRLEDKDAESPERLKSIAIDRLTRQQLILDRISLDEQETTSQTIISFSQRDRNRRYLVELKYRNQLETVTEKAPDDHIVKEFTMHMQSGDTIEIVSYELTHNEEIDNHGDESESNENATYFHVRLVVNEFAVDLHDPLSLYYYIIGQLSSCDAKIIYRYSFGEEPLKTTKIGIDLHCQFQSLEFDDLEDIFQQT